MPKRMVFDRPLRRDPILVIWSLFNALMTAAALNRHTTWSGSLEWARVTGFVHDVATVAMASYLLLALMPALVRRRWRGPDHGTGSPARSAWAPGRHAGLEPASGQYGPRDWPYWSALPAPTVFDRPLRRDPIVVVWLLFTAVMALVALNRHTTWSGSLEPARLVAFLYDVTTMAMVSYLFLCLLPALLRWCWRGQALWWWRDAPQWWWRGGTHWPSAWAAQPGTAGVPRWAQGGSAAWGSPQGNWSPDTEGHGQRPRGSGGSGGAGWDRQAPGSSAASRETTSAGDSAWRGGTPWQQSPISDAGRAHLTRSRGPMVPSFTRIYLPEGPLPVGLPVPVSWETRGAHSVTINGKSGYPPSGSVDIRVDSTGQCFLTAEGPGRSARHAWTAPVPTIELPTPRIQLPAGPGVNLHTEVDISDGRDDLVKTLRGITDTRLAFSFGTERPSDPTATQRGRPGSAFDVRALLRPLRTTTRRTSRAPETPPSQGEP